MIETIEIKWDLLGAKLATLSDDEQSKFFEGFAFELSRYESTTSNRYKYYQLEIN